MHLEKPTLERAVVLNSISVQYVYIIISRNMGSGYVELFPYQK